MRRLGCLLFCLMPTIAAAEWTDRLSRELRGIDQTFSGELAVWVEDTRSQQYVGLRGDEPFYLASTVKLIVAVVFLQEVDAGRLDLRGSLRLQNSDYVDGAGRTNWQGPGTEFSLRHLFEQMLLVSDNTATDMIIRAIGEPRFNAGRQQLPVTGLQPVTTLKDVRRRLYAELTPAATDFGKDEFFRLRDTDDLTERLAIIAELTGTPIADMGADNIPAAYEQYYRTGLNSGSMRAMSDLLVWLIEEEPLSASSQTLLMDTLSSVQTGANRLKAGLPDGFLLLHKTGTQYQRACHIGVASPSEQWHPVTLAVCSRGSNDLTESAAAIRSVARAVVNSGVWALPINAD